MMDMTLIDEINNISAQRKRIFKVIWTRIYPIVKICSMHIKEPYAIDLVIEKCDKVKQLQELFQNEDINYVCNTVQYVCHVILYKHYRLLENPIFNDQCLDHALLQLKFGIYLVSAFIFIAAIINSLELLVLLFNAYIEKYYIVISYLLLIPLYIACGLHFAYGRTKSYS